MRIAVLIAASVLVAGCSNSVGGDAEKSSPSPTAPPSTSRTTQPPTSTVPAKPPAQGAPIGEVVKWIEAGSPADPGTFHVATRDGATTELGDDVAFVTPSGKTSCLTDAQYNGGALTCLVQLADPPPRPADAEGEWKGGWIDYNGTTVQIGSLHGDPGPFIKGDGAQLPYGQALAFGDFRCRSDQTGLFCVNYAHQSAARFSDGGVEPFGCLQPATAPPQIGEMFSC
jgi:hypothetical protein